MRAFLIIGILLLVVMSPAVLSQQKKETKTEPAHKMIEFHMALLKRGPKWSAELRTRKRKRLQDQHVEYVTSLLDSGKAVIAGPLTDGGEIGGVFVFRATSPEEAKAWAEADPTGRGGIQDCGNASVVVGGYIR